MQEKRVDLYLDAVTYIALKHRANEVERSVSQHLRHLVKRDIELSLDQEAKTDGRSDAGTEGER